MSEIKSGFIKEDVVGGGQFVGDRKHNSRLPIKSKRI